MVRVTSTKAMRNSGAGLVRSVGKSDMRGTKAKPSALRRLAQGSKVEKKGSAAKSRKTSPTPKAKRVSSSDSGDAVSDSSRDSRQSSGSEGLDCLCNAVQLELSNGGDDTMEHDNLEENEATTPRKDIDARVLMTSDILTPERGQDIAERPRVPTAMTTTVGAMNVAGALDVQLRQQLSLQTTTTTAPAAAEAATTTTGLRGNNNPGTAGSAFEAVAPRAQTDVQTTATVAGTVGGVMTQHQRQELILQVQREQYMIIMLEQKYGKNFPEVGRRNLSLSRLLSSLGEAQMASYCLTQSWESFRANFSVSRSPLSCIEAYKAIFKTVKGYIDGDVQKQMNSMEVAVAAARKAAASGGSAMKRVVQKKRVGGAALPTSPSPKLTPTPIVPVPSTPAVLAV